MLSVEPPLKFSGLEIERRLDGGIYVHQYIKSVVKSLRTSAENVGFEAFRSSRGKFGWTSRATRPAVAIDVAQLQKTSAKRILRNLKHLIIGVAKKLFDTKKFLRLNPMKCRGL